MKCSEKWCHNEAAPNRKRCEQCMERARISRKTTTTSRYERGLCIDCGYPRSAEFTRCAICRKKARGAAARWRERQKAMNAELIKDAMEKIPNPIAEMIEREKSGGCALCGSMKGLRFHHIHPEERSFKIGNGRDVPTLEALMAEMDKCVVLCWSCAPLVRGKHRNLFFYQKSELFVELWDAAHKSQNRPK